jgi:NitT/TauT family transport system permease protein
MTAAHAEVVAAAAVRRRPFRPTRHTGLMRLAILVAVLALWELYARTLGDPAFISPPTRIVETLFGKILVEDKVRTAVLLAFVELAIAFALSVALAVPIGLVVGATRFLHRSLFPIVLLAYAIPQVTVLPLFVLIFGLGPESKVAFGVSHGVLPIIVNVIAGLRNVNPLYVNSARSMGASRAQILLHVTLPSVIASFFTGLRLAMTLTLLGVLLAELYVSVAGIGHFTQLYAETSNPAPLFALISVLALMAIVLNELVRRAELHYSRWKQ